MEDVLAEVNESARLLGLSQNDPRVIEAHEVVRIAFEDGRPELAFEIARSVLLRGFVSEAA